MRRVFADTGFFIVLANEDDSRHGTAWDYKKYFVSEGYSFVYTDLVFAELIRPGRHRLNWRLCARIGAEVQSGEEYELVRGAAYEVAAWKDFFLKYDDKEFSFCDCVSFAIMKDLGIKEVITTDQDFGRINLGFEPVYLLPEG
jgi:predicted nucleic acid-binding protein